MANKKKEDTAKTELIENTVAAVTAEVIPATKKEETPRGEIPAAEAPKKRVRKSAAAKADAPAETKKKPAARGRKSAAAKKESAAEVKTEAPKEETTAAEAPKKRGRKPAATKSDIAAETKKKASAPRGRKPAEDKKTAAADVKTETPKKRGRKPAAEKKAETASAKGGRKKAVTYDSVMKAAKKKISSANLSKIKYPIAVNVELSGAAEGVFYIVISDGKVDVEPFKYDDYDVYFRADAEEIMKVFGDKKNIYDALADGLIKVDGNTKKAILFIHAGL